MSFNVAEFRANMIGDGARPNLFSVSLVFPTNVINSTSAGQKLTFMAKTAQLPGSSIGTVPVYYFGREMKFPGNRTFADWTLTIINDEDFAIRNALENWMNTMNSHAGNVRSPAARNSGGYSVDANVIQYAKTGQELKKYKFVDDQLNYIDKKGRRVDSEGRLVNEDGRYINEDGKLVDIEGNLVDEEGNYIVDVAFVMDNV